MDKRNIVLITDLRTAEAQDACSFLSSKGYEVVTVPDGLPLWNPEPLSAFAETVADRLLGVIHPAPPLFFFFL